MQANHYWVNGTTQAGKTAQLVAAYAQIDGNRAAKVPPLVLAANRETRLGLSHRLAAIAQGTQATHVYTPLGFCQSEVTLFWPLVLETVGVRSQFPVILRSENEQYLAKHLWQEVLADLGWAWPGLSVERVVRRILDLQQLASQAGIAPAQLQDYLDQGLPELSELGRIRVGQCLSHWRTWCLDHAFLSYSLMVDVYTHHIWQHPVYQSQLLNRFQGLWADDVDEYPAFLYPVLAHFLQQADPCWLSWSSQGSIRMGLGADPSWMETLTHFCDQTLERTTPRGLAPELAELAIASLDDPFGLPELPNSIVSIQTITRAQLLRQMAATIAQAVEAGTIQPHEIAIIGPGFDAIARYVLKEILTNAGIPITVLNEQRPLISVARIRVLLTLLAFIYPGLGRLIDRDRVAEMLSVLQPQIDPVRAGLIADHCYAPHPDTPTLLPHTVFPRWDRLGYQATMAYQTLLGWIAGQQEQRQQRLLPSVTVFFDRAIQTFLWPQSLSTSDVAALRELLEVSQRFGDIEARLESPGENGEPHNRIADFIQLLQAGTIAANPYPVKVWGAQKGGVTLATVFQYRSSRFVHRWQLWLDAGSPRWLTGSDSLYRAELFLHDRGGQPWNAEELLQTQEKRLRRILHDLLSRTQERVFLCHSDLSTSGQEQIGPLLALINAAPPWENQAHIDAVAGSP